MQEHGERVIADDVFDRIAEPAARAASISAGRIARLELAMSTVLLIIAEMPVPDPPPLTAMTTFGLISR